MLHRQLLCCWRLAFAVRHPAHARQDGAAGGAAYTLAGVVEHQGGSMGTGHYIAYVSRRAGPAASPARAAGAAAAAAAPGSPQPSCDARRPGAGAHGAAAGAAGAQPEGSVGDGGPGAVPGAAHAAGCASNGLAAEEAQGVCAAAPAPPLAAAPVAQPAAAPAAGGGPGRVPNGAAAASADASATRGAKAAIRTGKRQPQGVGVGPPLGPPVSDARCASGFQQAHAALARAAAAHVPVGACDKCTAVAGRGAVQDEATLPGGEAGGAAPHGGRAAAAAAAPAPAPPAQDGAGQAGGGQSADADPPRGPQEADLLWWRVSDTQVRAVDWEAVSRVEAYILMYVKTTPAQP
jgi:hypothetical protein